MARRLGEGGPDKVSGWHLGTWLVGVGCDDIVSCAVWALGHFYLHKLLDEQVIYSASQFPYLSTGG